MPKIKNVFVYKPEQLPDDYSAMRGPCPEGFHIPSFDEIVALRDMFNTMGLLSGGTSNFISYLKIPTHSRLKGDLTRASDVASTIRMCNENGGIGAWHIMSSSMGIMGSGYNSRGVPIRPFKDISIAPESSWTTIYDGSSTAIGAGVFWDTTNGLISTSDDGLTWITIADKNLGATTVSTGRVGNDITRCGNFYQRGNNYGFTATVSTTSSAKVDTTGYGPGNYYESSTWITTSDSRWFNPFNGNLRGGVTGVVPGGNQLVEKEIYPNKLKYQITFTYLFYDWTSLTRTVEVVQKVNVGDTPVPDFPTTDYDFEGFDKTLAPATENTTYVGTYRKIPAGIYYKSSSQIVSLSKDGTNRLTVSDRDLGGNPSAIGAMYYWGNSGNENWEIEISAKPGYRCMTEADYQNMKDIFDNLFGSTYDFRPYIYMYTGGASYPDTEPNGYYWTSKAGTDGVAFHRALPDRTTLPTYNVGSDAYKSGVSGYNTPRRHPVRPVKVTAVKPDTSRTVKYQKP